MSQRKTQKYRSKTGQTYFNDEEEPPTPEQIKELDRLLYVTNRTLLQYRPQVIQTPPIKLDDFMRPINVAKLGTLPYRAKPRASAAESELEDPFDLEMNRIRGPGLIKGEAYPLTDFTILDGKDFAGSPGDSTELVGGSSEAAPFFVNTIEKVHNKAQSHIMRLISLTRDYDPDEKLGYQSALQRVRRRQHNFVFEGFPGSPLDHRKLSSMQPTVSKLAKTALAIGYSSTAGKMVATKAVEDKL